MLRFRVFGVKSDEQGQVHLTQDWGVYRPDGQSLFQRNDDEMVKDQYFYPPAFVPYREYLETTSSIAPGEYRFRVVVHDKIGGADFTLDQPFTITKP